MVKFKSGSGERLPAARLICSMPAPILRASKVWYCKSYDAMQLRQCDANEFEGFSQCDVLAIDNLDAIAGNPQWEACFYQVINRCRDGDYRFVFAMTHKPDDLQTTLDDFRSRLQWGLLLQLPSSDDDRDSPDSAPASAVDRHRVSGGCDFLPDDSPCA